jgi:hypothetical protein
VLPVGIMSEPMLLGELLVAPRLIAVVVAAIAWRQRRGG